MELPIYSIENPNQNPNQNIDLDNNLPPSYEDSIILTNEINNDRIFNDNININNININNNELELNNIYTLNKIINLINLLFIISSCYYIFFKIEFFIILIIINIINYWIISKYNVCGYIILFIYIIIDIIFKIIIFKETDKQDIFYIYFIIILIITYLVVYYFSCKIIILLCRTSNENLNLLRQGYIP